MRGSPWPRVFKAFIRRACAGGAGAARQGARYLDHWKEGILTPTALEVLAAHCRHFRVEACWLDKKTTRPDGFRFQIMLGAQRQANKWG
eukprot:8373243-Pyramimonas_sp.AAC.1